MEKKPTRRIGKYEIISKVAEGGMGSLYKARHPTLDRVVLLKKLALRGGSQFVERFKREARLMMDFKNDHIVQVHDHFKEGQHYFIVEEYVDGISLDALIRRERYLTNEAALLILYEVCKALRYAHDKQVIHRDIKPGNVLLSRQGEVKLADFGIATSLEDTDDGLTREGMVLGTPAYIPPEQIDDAKSVDRRADIYSVGVVLYEMLTGKTPYPGSFTAETIHLIQKGRYTPPRKLNPRASRLLRSIGRKCMRVKPRRRYQDLGEIVRILEKHVRRRDPESIRQAVKNVVDGKDIGALFKRRHRWLAWFLPAVVLAGLAAAGGWHLYRQGWWFEAFAPGRYGVLVVSAVVDGAYKQPEEVFFQPVLYKDEETQLTRIAGIDFGLHVDDSRTSTESFTVSSSRIYLEAGRYRLKISLEDELFWSSFTVAPRIAQRLLLSTADGLRITVRQDSRQRPMEVSARVTDTVTGEDLANATAMSVFLNNRWIPWRSTTPRDFASGASYRFRFEKEGYYAQTYSLIVKPYQTLLNFVVGLVPEPGTLLLHSSAPGAELLLNGSDYYLSGGRDGRFQKLAPLGTESSRQLDLNPGDYRLTVRRAPAIEKTVSFHLGPHASVSVNVVFDASRGALDVTLNE
jgi:eukaryotic-like serine/threonine-protein kinase